MSGLTCRDVHQLKHFYSLMQRESSQDLEKRVKKLLTRVFEHYLRGKQLLLPSRNEKKVSPPVYSQQYKGN